jgi:hypothetical protein
VSRREETTHEEYQTTYYAINSFAPADKSIPYRLVGSFEYSNALDALEKLVANSTPEQIAVYDKILKDRKELSYFSGMMIQGVTPEMVQKMAIGDPNQPDAAGQALQQFNQNFQMQGLASMMALAKIELGASIAAYGESKQPFSAFPPTRFDLEPFLNLMLEDVSAHLNALNSDPFFVEILKPKYGVDSWTVAYLRRLKLVRDMLAVLQQTNDPRILGEVAIFDQKLKRYQRGLAEKVALVENLFVSSSDPVEGRTYKSTRETQREHLGECRGLLNSLGEN